MAGRQLKGGIMIEAQIKNQYNELRKRLGEPETQGTAVWTFTRWCAKNMKMNYFNTQAFVCSLSDEEFQGLVAWYKIEEERWAKP
jgi:hypothetical protein